MYTADFIENARAYWVCIDSTNLSREKRVEMIKGVKRFFLTGVEDWMNLPRYIQGVCRSTWVQLIKSIDTFLPVVDPAYAARKGITIIHSRTLTQDLLEGLLGCMTNHKTVDLFESRIAWAAYELRKTLDAGLGFWKRVSTRKRRITDISDDSRNPYLEVDGGDNVQVRKTKTKRSQWRPKHLLASAARNSNKRQVRSECRSRYARPENNLPHALPKYTYNIYTAVNAAGNPILHQKTEATYNALLQRVPQPSKEELEWNVPQHLDISPEQAHPAWKAFRAEERVSASDCYVILRDKDSNVSWTARQKFYKVCAGLENSEPITDPDMLQACREGHLHEADAGATAVKHMLSHTNGHAEQVGIVALPGDLNWIKASPDYVLHKPEECASFPGTGIGPLECKKPFEKYRCFHVWRPSRH